MKKYGYFLSGMLFFVMACSKPGTESLSASSPSVNENQDAEAAPPAPNPVATEPELAKAPFNQVVLEVIKSMPVGGGYAITSAASKALISAVQLDSNGNFKVDAGLAKPSFCSGATYLVFLNALIKHFSSNQFASPLILQALRVLGQPDGQGVWGRWNANGPGTARLASELGIGKNHNDWKKAQPGDFMKMFWSSEIGKKESGHSVVFIGESRVKNVDYVIFWSSNQPNGMGQKTIEKSKIKRVIFTHIDEPSRILQAPQLPKTDQYLAEMLTRSSTPAEMAKMIGLNQ